MFREIDGEAVLLDLQRGTYFGLDAVGTRIWELIREHATLTVVCDEIVREFDVDASRATADLLEFVERLANRGLIEVAP